jgi:hypothetical protein
MAFRQLDPKSKTRTFVELRLVSLRTLFGPSRAQRQFSVHAFEVSQAAHGPLYNRGSNLSSIN